LAVSTSFGASTIPGRRIVKVKSATRLALDRDVAAHHLTEVRLMATPRPVALYLRAVADEI